MRIKEWEKEIIFLHEVGPGVADRSYGIHVAQMAGLPQAVIARAEQVLATLETKAPQGLAEKRVHALPDFTATVAAAPPSRPSERDCMLASLNPDEMTPKEALEWLYKLKKS